MVCIPSSPANRLEAWRIQQTAGELNRGPPRHCRSLARGAFCGGVLIGATPCRPTTTAR